MINNLCHTRTNANILFTILNILIKLSLRRANLALLVTRSRLPLGQTLVGTLNHEACNVYSPKAFEALIHENDIDIVPCSCAKYLFFWFYRSVRFEAKNVSERARITSLVGK